MVKENTHQEVRNGRKCRARCTDHIYTNSVEKLKDTKAVLESGSHHKLLVTTVMERMVLKGPQQHKGFEKDIQQ